MSQRKLLISSDEEDDEDYIYVREEFTDFNGPYAPKFRRTTRGKAILGFVIMAAVVVLVTLLFVFLLPSSSHSLSPADDPLYPPRPSNTTMGVFPKAVVVTNGYLCASIGKDVLLEGGNAVDAAIATLLCEGVLNPHSMGVGGGFLMTIYLKDQKKAIALNARETAPAAATMDMYHGNSSLSQRGALSIAVPGELRGYQEAFEKYGSGKITWARLFKPTIELCENGYKLPPYLAKVFREREKDIFASPGLRELLVNPQTGKLIQEGDILKFPKLAETFKTVSGVERANAIYNGSLTDAIVKDIQDIGGIITRQDLENYQVQWQEPVSAVFKEHVMYSVPLPGSGLLVAFMLNILDVLLPGTSELSSLKRIVESFKFGYGRRTELGDMSQSHFVPDPDFMHELVKNLTSPSYASNIASLISDKFTSSDPEYYGATVAQPVDHGTAHINILAPNGDAVAATSTINLILGSFFVSPSTGIIMNDEMDDFSSPNITNAFDLPPSPANFIFPGKRPLSSMSPSIFVNKDGDVSLVAGAAGGSTITTTTTLMAIHNLLYNLTIKETLDAKRIHHQLFPMQLEYENGIEESLLDGLQLIGHVLTGMKNILSTATGIARLGDQVSGAYDKKRGGSVDGF